MQTSVVAKTSSSMVKPKNFEILTILELSQTLGRTTTINCRTVIDSDISRLFLTNVPPIPFIELEGQIRQIYAALMGLALDRSYLAIAIRHRLRHEH